MSFDALPAEVRQILHAQQQQITRLSEMIGGLSEAVLASTSLSGKVHEHAIGQAAAFQVFAEILIAISPELRHHVRVAMERILANPDTTANEHLRSVVEALHRAASETGNGGGQRPGLHLVPPPGDHDHDHDHDPDRG